MRIITVSRDDPDPDLIEEVVDSLLDGEVIAYPTDTLYGLGCDATNTASVGRLRAIKGRSEELPLPVIVSNRSVLAHLVHGMTDDLAPVIERYWPGALTVIFGT